MIRKTERYFDKTVINGRFKFKRTHYKRTIYWFLIIPVFVITEVVRIIN